MDDVYLPEKITDEEIQELVTSNVVELSVIEKQANQASSKAKAAKERAEKVRGLHTGHVFNKASIEELKNSNLELAEALESSTLAQVKMQQYQTALTKFLAISLQISLSSVAAGDAAIERLKQIVSDNKKSKEIGAQTRERIDEIISSIKNQQTFFKKMDDIKKTINEQQVQINSLSQKIDAISFTTDEDGKINGDSLALSLNAPLKQIVDICNENNETLRNGFNSLNDYLVEEATLIKNVITNKCNNTDAVLNEHMFVIRDYFKRADDSYIKLLEMVSLESANFKTNLEDINNKCLTLKEQNDELIQKIEEMKENEKKKAAMTKRMNIIMLISIGVVALLTIACLIIILVKK